MIFIRNAAETAAEFDYNMRNCSTYDVANGGDAPECYQYHLLPGEYSVVRENEWLFLIGASLPWIPLQTLKNSK